MTPKQKSSLTIKTLEQFNNVFKPGTLIRYKKKYIVNIIGYTKEEDFGEAKLPIVHWFLKNQELNEMSEQTSILMPVEYSIRDIEIL